MNTKRQIRLPIIISIAIAAGVLIGATMNNESSISNDLYGSILTFKEVLMYVDREYVDDVNSDQLIESAIQSMLEKLDPHSAFIPAEELALANAPLDGAFEGIGIEFNIFKDTIYVVAPLSGGPSEKAGLISGDKIITIDDENVAGINISNRGVIDRLRGTKGTEVTVGILRKSEKDLLYFTITRDKIPQYSVDVSYMINEDIGYIKVSRFAATTYHEFVEALSKLKSKGMQKLILDLQSNPGGYMDQAIKMVDELLGGDKLIVYTEGKRAAYNQRSRTSIGGIFEEQPLIVLIDEGSASASEILSGALQDHDRALIVGRRSFGKGLVQIPIDLALGSQLRLTISRYYTPSGRSIQKPYGKKPGDYDRELLRRFEHGEYFSADSISFADSLIFKTSKGRTVYGGGGIMPDHFVPFDTTLQTTYFRKLFTSNALREFTLKYYEEHKNALEKMEFATYKADFKVSEDILKGLIKTAEENGVTFNKEEFNISKPLIKVHVRAQIARLVWDNEGFYPIFNETNEIFQSALGLFEEAEALLAQK